MRVYILSSYQENGAEDVMATLDKARVPALMDAWFARPEFVHVPPEDIAQHHAKLAELLAADAIAAKNGTDLSNGWGGLQLHIVELA